MKVEEFIEEYNKTENKNNFIKQHILKDKYVSYLEKMTMCQKIIQNTMYIKVGDKDVFKKNTPIQNAIFSMVLINTYTDIDIEFENGIWSKYFDLLCKNNLITELIGNIPQNEYDLWNMLIVSMVEDVMCNTRTLVSFIDSKSESLNIFKEMIMSSVESALQQS